MVKGGTRPAGPERTGMDGTRLTDSQRSEMLQLGIVTGILSLVS